MSYSFPPSQQRIGKTLPYDFWGYQTTLLVKGIFADIPLNTSLERRPEAIISFPTIGRHLKWDLGWQSGGNYDGYLRLRSPQDADWLNERMSIAIARHIPPYVLSLSIICMSRLLKYGR